MNDILCCFVVLCYDEAMLATQVSAILGSIQAQLQLGPTHELVARSLDMFLCNTSGSAH